MKAVLIDRHKDTGSRQRGDFILMAVVMVAIVGLLLTQWSVQNANQLHLARAERAGEALKTMGEIMSTFLLRHHKDLNAGWVPGHVGDGVIKVGSAFLPLTYRADGWAEVDPAKIQDIVRVPGFGARPPQPQTAFGLSIRADSVNRQQVFSALSYLSDPMSRSGGNTDMSAAAFAARVIGANALVSTLDSPGILKFLGADREEMAKLDPVLTTPVANPVDPPAAAVVGVLSGARSVPVAHALPRDGSRAMTGDFKLGGYDVNEAKTVTASTVRTDRLHSDTGRLNVESGVAKELVELRVDGNVKTSRDVDSSDSVKMGDPNMKTKPNSDTRIVVNETVQTDSMAGDGKVNIVLEGKGTPTTLSSEALEVTGRSEVERVTANRIESTTDVVAQGSLISRDGVLHLNDVHREGDGCAGLAGAIGMDSDGNVLLCRNRDQHSRNAPPYWARFKGGLKVKHTERADSFSCFGTRNHTYVDQNYTFCFAEVMQQNSCGGTLFPTREASIWPDENNPLLWHFRVVNVEAEIRCYGPK